MNPKKRSLKNIYKENNIVVSLLKLKKLKEENKRHKETINRMTKRFNEKNAINVLEILLKDKIKWKNM